MNTFAGYALCDPRDPRENRVRFRRDALAMLERANSFYCPAGRLSSRGWVLLPRSEYNSINRYSTSLTLDIGGTVTLQNLVIVQAQCVTRGLASDPDALYLIELTDRRGVVHNDWVQFPLTATYNVWAPAYPRKFYDGSMNSGAPWTWTTMLRNIWERMGDFLGTWPGLPAEPIGTPEGFWFTGVSAWDALNDTLEHLGLSIACDLTSGSPFTIVVDGADDPAFSAMQTQYVTNLEDDLEWLDFGSGRSPATVKVLFRRRNSVYGTEETVRYDSPQWSMTPFYEVSVAAPAAYAGGVGTHYLWSDFTVRYDDDGNPLSADVTEATLIAQDRVQRYYGHIHPFGQMSQTYSGAIPFSTGSEVDGVCWYQDNRSTQQGWCTQVVHAPGRIPWPELWSGK